MSPSTPANFRLLPPNTHCILSHWNGSSGFSVYSSLPAKRPNTSHSAWQNQLTDQSSSSSASRPSQSVQWCRFIFRHLFASTNQGNESKGNSRDLQNNLLIISYTIVPPVSYLFAHRRSYHLFFHISIFKCNYLFHTPVFHNPGIPEYTFPLPHALKL